MKIGDKVIYGNRECTVVEMFTDGLCKVLFNDNNLYNFVDVNSLHLLPEINYEKLLDDWAEDVLREANLAEEKKLKG